MGNNNGNNNEDENNNIEYTQPIETKVEPLKELILKGEYSEIYKSINDNNENIIFKIIDKNNISQILSDINQIDLDNYIEEKISLMKEINSKTDFSVKIFSNNKLDDNYCIEMEYCDLNLRQYFDEHFKEKGMEINDIRDILKKLNDVFTLLEEKKVYHGDIKPEHILISTKDSNNIIPKLTDYFCFSTFSKKFNIYNAPEIFEYLDKNSEVNIKSEIWSIGLIMYELYFNCLPFKTKEELEEIIKNKKKINLLKTEDNNDFNDLIKRCLTININERISFDNYINHNFWKIHPSPNIEEDIISSQKNINKNQTEEMSKGNNNKVDIFSNQKKEFIFEFKTNNYDNELNVFTKNNLKDIEIFKFAGFKSKKDDLGDKKIIKWIKNLKFPNLQKLYLSENDIENLEGFNEITLDNLTHLYLNTNKINEIKDLSQAKFENLLLLDLSQNDIINIETLSKSKFKNLSILNLSENKISDISPLKNFTYNNLKILNLSFNQIQNIDILSQVSFINLKSLYLNNNKIINIEVFSSVPFEKLEILNLSNNDIDKIISLNNTKYKTLKKLDLSFNKIENIEIIKSSKFDNLEFLNIAFNKLNNLDIFEEIKLKSIKKISFYGNDSINFFSSTNKEIIKNLKNRHPNLII